MASKKSNQSVLKMKQLSIRDFFVSTKPSTKTDEIPKVELQSERPKIVQKSKAVKRKLDHHEEHRTSRAKFFKSEYDKTLDIAREEVFDNEEKEEVREMLNVIDQCEVSLVLQDCPLKESAKYDEEIPEMNSFKSDYSLLCFLIRQVFSKHHFLF